ncbi:MAG: hypothetical protein ACE5I0_02505, partial [Candidatus Binatia bacterium]
SILMIRSSDIILGKPRTTGLRPFDGELTALRLSKGRLPFVRPRGSRQAARAQVEGSTGGTG